MGGHYFFGGVAIVMSIVDDEAFLFGVLVSPDFP